MNLRDKVIVNLPLCRVCEKRPTANLQGICRKCLDEGRKPSIKQHLRKLYYFNHKRG